MWEFNSLGNYQELADMCKVGSAAGAASAAAAIWASE
jgi:hypothetical protein